MTARYWRLHVILLLGCASELLQQAQSLSSSSRSPPSPSVLSRREAITSGASTILATAATVATTSLAGPSPSYAGGGDASLSSIAIDGPPERQALLRAISAPSNPASDEEVTRLISELEPLDPSKSNGAAAPELDGTWELIYSLNTEAFSPLLQLPPPIRPTSLQLLGEDAAREVGEGRVAQVLNFPIVPLSLVLSSATVPISGNVLEIRPPFRFEAVWADGALRRPGRLAKGLPRGGVRWELVDSGSDADFRALNARDEDAQAAGRNKYKQLYLETSGKTGDLRISTITDGDPVIVGAVFIHRRL